MVGKIWKYKGQKKECVMCHKIFEPKYNKRNEWKYCSLKCCYKHRKVGWNSKRKEALKRAKNKCEKCGTTKKLYVHHIKPAIYSKKGHSPSKESNNKLDNLIVLCPSCHNKEHSEGIKRFTGKGKCFKCGKEFLYYPKSNRGKYCSRDCFYHYGKSVELKFKKECIFCGRSYFGVKKSKFCSKKCKSRDFYKKYGRKK